jgi:hypothetical protein
LRYTILINLQIIFNIKKLINTIYESITVVHIKIYWYTINKMYMKEFNFFYYANVILFIIWVYGVWNMDYVLLDTV